MQRAESAVQATSSVRGSFPCFSLSREKEEEKEEETEEYTEEETEETEERQEDQCPVKTFILPSLHYLFLEVNYCQDSSVSVLQERITKYHDCF